MKSLFKENKVELTDEGKDVHQHIKETLEIEIKTLYDEGYNPIEIKHLIDNIVFTTIVFENTMRS